MKTLKFNDSNRDKKLVKEIQEYQERQGIRHFIDAVRILCEDALAIKRAQNR